MTAISLPRWTRSGTARVGCDRGHGICTRRRLSRANSPRRIRASRHRRFHAPVHGMRQSTVGRYALLGCLTASPFVSTTQPAKRCCGKRSKERLQDRTHTQRSSLYACMTTIERSSSGWCIRLGRAAPDPGMRMVAALGISYLACRFRTVDPKAVELVRTLAADQVPGEPRSRVVGDALRRLERCIG